MVRHGFSEEVAVVAMHLIRKARFLGVDVELLNHFFGYVNANNMVDERCQRLFLSSAAFSITSKVCLRYILRRQHQARKRTRAS